MKSYLGISHLDYPNDPDGYIRALGMRELWPLVGFFIPISTMLLTRGMDITWVKGTTPPLWYAAILAVSGFGFPILFFSTNGLVSRLAKKLNLSANTEFDRLLPFLYSVNSDDAWRSYYFIKYIGGLTIFFKTTTMGWGISSIIYFAIRRV